MASAWKLKSAKSADFKDFYKSEVVFDGGCPWDKLFRLMRIKNEKDGTAVLSGFGLFSFAWSVP